MRYIVGRLRGQRKRISYIPKRAGRAKCRTLSHTFELHHPCRADPIIGLAGRRLAFGYVVKVRSIGPHFGPPSVP